MNLMLLSPVFVQVALTFVLLFWMGFARSRSLRDGAVRVKDIVLGQQAWPAQVTRIDRAFHNQLEMPLVFFALVALVIATSTGTQLFVWLEWLFVIFRVAHAAIHVTSNRLMVRFGVFVAGILTLIAMWVWFAARIVLGG
jgi:hypothetical protein